MKEKQKQPASFQPDRILSYFKAEWQVLLAVTISGLIYNVGLLAGPWFEGKLTGCLVDILRGAGQFGDMLILSIRISKIQMTDLYFLHCCLCFACWDCVVFFLTLPGMIFCCLIFDRSSLIFSCQKWFDTVP